MKNRIQQPEDRKPFLRIKISSDPLLFRRKLVRTQPIKSSHGYQADDEREDRPEVKVKS